MRLDSAAMGCSGNTARYWVVYRSCHARFLFTLGGSHTPSPAVGGSHSITCLFFLQMSRRQEKKAAAKRPRVSVPYPGARSHFPPKKKEKKKRKGQMRGSLTTTTSLSSVMEHESTQVTESFIYTKLANKINTKQEFEK